MIAGTCDLPAKCLVQTQFSSMDIMDVQNVKSRVLRIMRDTLWYSHLGIFETFQSIRIQKFTSALSPYGCYGITANCLFQPLSNAQ